MAFNDATCQKCKRRYGWTGKVTAKPKCPHCGNPVTDKEREELAADEKMMEEFVQTLRDNDEGIPEEPDIRG